MLRWFQALLPQEERFFELFARHSEIVVAGANALGRCWRAASAVAQHCRG